MSTLRACLCLPQAVWEEMASGTEYGRRSKDQKQRFFSQLVTPENPAYLHGYADSASDRDVNVPTLSGARLEHVSVLAWVLLLLALGLVWVLVCVLLAAFVLRVILCRATAGRSAWMAAGRTEQPRRNIAEDCAMSRQP